MWHKHNPTFGAPNLLQFGIAVAFLMLTGCDAMTGYGTGMALLGKSANDPDAPILLAQAQTGAATQPSATSPYLAPAPAIFEASGVARWDGKRTLQGVWVAHPDAATARRVRIFNEANGRAVDGALFKRDTGDGQDAVLISSEAAQLLGIVPGTRTEIRIVAVTPVEDAVVAATPEEPEQESEPATIPLEPDDPPVDAEASTPETAAAEPPIAETEATPEPVADAKEPVVAAAPTESEAPEPVLEEEQAEAASDPAVDEEITFQWERAPDPPEPAETPQAEQEPTQAAAPAASAPASALGKPYIQAGTFGVQSNAANLVARLEKLGIPALGRKVTAGGRQLTRVLAGPFQTRAQRDAAQRKIRGLGLRDAVPVRR